MIGMNRITNNEMTGMTKMIEMTGMTRLIGITGMIWMTGMV